MYHAVEASVYITLHYVPYTQHVVSSTVHAVVSSFIFFFFTNPQLIHDLNRGKVYAQWIFDVGFSAVYVAP